MSTLYVLRSRKDGRLYQQEYRGTYREVVPTATLEGIRNIHDLMMFQSREEAEKFIENPRPWYLSQAKAAEVCALDIELRELETTTKKATREHCVTDQGNGGAYCSNCGHSLDAPHNGLGMDIGSAPNPCPGCGLEWEEGSISGYSFGGSDF